MVNGTGLCLKNKLDYTRDQIILQQFELNPVQLYDDSRSDMNQWSYQTDKDIKPQYGINHWQQTIA